MADEKKKSGIVKQILKWIGLGLLGALLIAAIYSRAPWKVTALFLIILLGSTALPKRAIKWFWLCIGAIVIVLIIWVFLPPYHGQWRPYTFDAELAAIEAKRAIPDCENAAVIYIELFETLDLDSNRPEFFRESRPSSISGPWSAKEHPEMAQWLKQQQSTITAFMQACKKDQCRFPVDPGTKTFNQKIGWLVKMRHCAYLLISAGNNDIAEGRVDSGIEKYLCVIQTAKHQYQQPTMVDYLVGDGIETLALGKINRLIVEGNVSDKHLRLIEESLTQIKRNWGSDFPAILECDKLMAKNMMAMFYEINPRGKTRFARDPTAAMRTQCSGDTLPLPPLTYWQKKFVRAHTILAWFYMPSSPQKVAEAIDAAYEKYYAMAKPDFDWKKEPQESTPRFGLNYHYLVKHMADMLEGTCYKIYDISLRTIAQEKASKLITALRRYKNKSGRWPERIDDVKSLVAAEGFIDPMNGDFFVYKPTAENFTLYSKGLNNIDENGESEYVFFKETGPDDVLFWPIKSHTSKGEKNDAQQQKRIHQRIKK